MPVRVALVPVPSVVIPSMYLVSVQVPDEGNPRSTTLPVATVHVGGVIVPTDGAVGVDGCGLIVNSAEAVEVQPDAFVTV